MKDKAKKKGEQNVGEQCIIILCDGHQRMHKLLPTIHLYESHEGWI
jgi:hypothetical protein